MAETVSELAVRLTPEGMEETQRELDKTQDKFEETADDVGESSDELTAFAGRFKGAMGVAIAGLSVASAGLLAKVPVIGESMALLGGIFDGLIFQIDKELRPTMGGFNQDLADVQASVFEAEGPFDGLMTAIEGVDGAMDALAVNTIQDKIKEITGISVPEDWLDFGWNVLTLDAVDAFSALKRIVRGQLENVEGLLNAGGQGIVEFLNGIAERIESGVNNSIETLNMVPGVNITERANIPRLDDFEDIKFFNEVTGPGFRGRRGRTRTGMRDDQGVSDSGALTRLMAEFKRQDILVNIDGREMARTQQRFSDTETNRRGRYGL